MSVFDTTKTTSTTLPTWFNDAQKDLAGTAGTTLANTLPFDKTATAGMSKNLMGEDNPWMTSINTLNTIATQNANPWNADGTPNTQTALGGLFAAQNAKLENILPSITAKQDAAGIGGGNFGSLRGQTATNTARAGALTTLAEEQNKALLNAQTQAIQAATGAGNVGSQYSKSAIDTGTAEQAGGLTALKNYSDIINQIGLTMPKTTTETTSGSEYDNALKTLGALFGGQGITTEALAALKKAGGGLDWLKGIINPVTNTYADAEAYYNDPANNTAP